MPTIEEELAKNKEEGMLKLNTLSISINAMGQMQWSIPQDMTLAIFLHKHLDVIISKMIDSKLQKAFEQTPKIVKPGLELIK